MSWSIRLGRVGETQVRVHTTLLIFLAWFAWVGYTVSQRRTW